MTLNEKIQRLPPKTIIIVMFALILFSVVANLVYTMTRPACPCAEKKNIFKGVTEELQKPAPSEPQTLTYRELEERARKAKALLQSRQKLSHEDSVFIIKTGELLNATKKVTK